uniref:Secreted protein n=1 Tax=Anopheles funestus TaxID=62324 RepID=A0A182RA14_ANOFN
MHKCVALCFTILALVLVSLFSTAECTLQPKAPNFQYFERPKYRYPYYDENGKGKLLYGYGGPELYQYKSFSPLDGIH